jgi:hypothetical protein
MTPDEIIQLAHLTVNGIVLEHEPGIDPELWESVAALAYLEGRKHATTNLAALLDNASHSVKA